MRCKPIQATSMEVVRGLDSKLFLNALSDICTRPVNRRRERIAPSDLHDHRATHHLQFPGCFCPIQDGGLGLNKETAIYMPIGGPYKNQWVAACATQDCLYLGTWIETALISYLNWNLAYSSPLGHFLPTGRTSHQLLHSQE